MIRYHTAMAKTKLSDTLQTLIARRGRRTLRSMRRYLALCRIAGSEGLRDKVDGPSPGGAAVELGISRQAVHRAISRGTLDAWYVSTPTASGGEGFYVFVTEESMRRYKASGRRRS
jgi:hypothetical protein